MFAKKDDSLLVGYLEHVDYFLWCSKNVCVYKLINILN